MTPISRRALWLLFAAAACTQSGPGELDAGTPPTAVCAAPVQLADVSSPTTVVGDGTAASCTETALQAALDKGGTVTFNCGAAPHTLVVTKALRVAKATVIDGNGQITLSGGGKTRILYFDSAYDQATPRLTVQRLTFKDGKSAPGGDDTAVGGGAIYRDGGSLTVIDCTFLNNQAPSPGQDIAGGAIYGFGGGETVIVGSTFVGNSASNGGAVGSLNGNLTLTNSTFTGNQATGTDGNPGNGGAGGAIYMDGGKETVTLCGVKIQGNKAGAIGGGFFRVSNDNTGKLVMERTTVDGNQVTASGKGNAGGMYLQGLEITMSRSTVSRNTAFFNGGLWLGANCKVTLTNVTVAENTATGSNGGGLWLASASGTLQNCTIANNHSTGANQISGAIFGGNVTLKNTLIAGNTAMYTPNCNEKQGAGGGNLQWPGTAPCTTDVLVKDPLLGPLSDRGGETETMEPGASSPALGHGSGCPAIDQRGSPRKEPCTTGAVEVE